MDQSVLSEAIAAAYAAGRASRNAEFCRVVDDKQAAQGIHNIRENALIAERDRLREELAIACRSLRLLTDCDILSDRSTLSELVTMAERDHAHLVADLSALKARPVMDVTYEGGNAKCSICARLDAFIHEETISGVENERDLWFFYRHAKEEADRLRDGLRALLDPPKLRQNSPNDARRTK